MNVLLLNRDGFQMPADGWYQVAPLGEFAHAQAGLVQVVDSEACQAMANRFADEAKGANFAGLLVDFDHFSLDGEKRSEAAGWITGLENRVEGGGLRVEGGEASTARDAKGTKVGNAGGGLWAKIRWSDVGEEAVKGGRYRFLSPVWARSDCVDLGPSAGSGQGMRRVRPVRLLNAAVTNDPNLKGMQPLSNRVEGGGLGVEGREISRAENAKGAEGENRFKWVLGETQEGRHCPSCAAVAGQVHTMAEWDASGVKPGAGGLYCQGKCQCRLEATGDAAGGVLKDVPVRKGEAVKNGQAVGRSDSPSDGSRGDGEVLANVGWTNEARAASLAVRRAKAAVRQGSGGGKKGEREKKREGNTDFETWFQEEGLTGMTPKAVNAYADQLREKMAAGDEALTEVEEGFLESITDKGYEGINQDDPIFQWQMDRAKKDERVRQATGMSLKEARMKVGDIEIKMDGTEPVTPEEEALVDAYHKVMAMGNRGRSVQCSVFSVQGEREIAPAGRRSHRSGEEDGDCIAALVNTGWTDQARVAALAVRRAKAGMRVPAVTGKQYLSPPLRELPVGWRGTPTYGGRPVKGVPPVRPPLPPARPKLPVQPKPPKKMPPPIRVPPYRGGRRPVADLRYV